MSKAIEIQATTEILNTWGRLKDIRAMITEEDELKAQIMVYMKEADTLKFGDQTICTWKLGKPAKRLDTKALQSAKPEVYQEFLKEGEPSRRFLVK